MEAFEELLVGDGPRRLEVTTRGDAGAAARVTGAWVGGAADAPASGGLAVSLVDGEFFEAARRQIDAGRAEASDFKFCIGFSAWAPRQLADEWGDCDWLGAQAAASRALLSVALSQPLAGDGGATEAEAEEAKEVALAIAEAEGMLRGSLAAAAGAEAAAVEAMLPEMAWARLHEVRPAARPAPPRVHARSVARVTGLAAPPQRAALILSTLAQSALSPSQS